MRDISKNIKQLRIQKGMTQDELAEVLFVTRQTVSNYETGKSRPDIDMLIKISEALETDVNTVIYGVQLQGKEKQRWWRIAAAVVIPVGLLILSAVLLKKGKIIAAHTFDTTLNYICICLIRPVGMFIAGWCALYLLGQLFGFNPLNKKWVKWARLAVIIVCIFFAAFSVFYLSAGYGDYYRSTVKISQWLSWLIIKTEVNFYHNPWIFPILGAALWIFGFPKKKEKTDISG